MSDRTLLALMLLATSLLFLIGLGRGTLWDQDEAKYTQVAREILQTGDPITLHVNGAPWFVHPPLYMWLQALVGRVWGFNEFTARLWSAIFGVIGVLVTVQLGRALFGPRTGLLAGMILATSFQYFAQSRLAIFDGVLVTFMLLAFYAFLRAVREGRPHLLVWAGVWAGLGTLTKGPIALLLPGLVGAAFLLLRRDHYNWRRLRWFPALLAYALLATPWYLVEWVRHGWPFVQTVFGYYTFNRFFGVVEGQAGPWWYYGPVLILGLFPWTAFVMAALVSHVRRTVHEGSLLVVLWCGLTVIFYSLAGTKLPNYVLPLYPWAALGTAAMWDRLLAGDRAMTRYLSAAWVCTALALLAFAVEIVLFARMVYPVQFAALARHLFGVGVGLTAWLLGAGTLYALRRHTASLAVLTATGVVLAGVLIGRTLPLVEAHRPIKAVAAAIRPELRPGTTLAAVNLWAQQTLLFYTDHPVVWLGDAGQLRRVLCDHERVVVVTRSGEHEQLMRDVALPPEMSMRLLVAKGDLTASLKEGTVNCSGTP